MTSSKDRCDAAAAGALLVALAWGLATGGTAALDLLVIGGLALIAVGCSVALGTAIWKWHDLVLPVIVLGVVTGMALLHDGRSADALRVPALLALSTGAYAAVAPIGRRRQEWLFEGTVALGVGHALIAVVQAIDSLAHQRYTLGSMQADGLVGSPNALGAFLVVTVILTLRRPARSRHLVTAALAVQLTAIMATGSRLAILAALTAVAVQRRRSRASLAPTVVVVAGLAALAAAARSVTDPFVRFELWTAAVHRLAASPWVGSGLQHDVLTTPGPGIPASPYAHDEPLQLALEYGLPVALLLTGAIGWALASTVRRTSDRWLVAAAGVVLASGLIDVTLRATPLALLCAVLLAAARPTAAPRADWAAPRPADRPTPRPLQAAFAGDSG